MEPASSLYSTILLLGAAHGVFLSFALFAMRTGNRTALRLLALLTLAFAIDLAVNYLIGSRHLVRFPRLLFVESVAVFLYGPLLYFYVLALTSREQWQMTWCHWLHFLPAVVSIVLLVPYFGLSDASLVDMVYAGRDVGSELGVWAVGKPIVDSTPRILIAAYLLLGFHRLAQHSRNIRDQFSHIEHISLTWLRNLLIAIGVLWVQYAAALAFGGVGPVENVLNIAIVVVVYTLGYMGMRQPAIFTQRGNRVAADEEPRTDGQKYARSALDEESSAALMGELQALMAKDRPYLEPTLTLAQLAEKAGLSSNYLSQIINQQTGSNFFDYVNGHRVAAAKQVLADPDKARLSVLTVAMDAGFNSKSAFYTAFKHHAGVTPSDYRRLNLS